MAARDVLEVDTPILSRYGVTDPFIENIQAKTSLTQHKQLYLHTSPEFCMKRLLAAGVGDIYQICHVFRDDELGQRHMIEFSMLEWYRLGLDYQQLMDEVCLLLHELGLETPRRKRYADAFLETIKIDPLQASIESLQQLAIEAGWEAASDDRHELLDFIFSQLVIKKIKNAKSLIIYDYPACMAALARLSKTNPAVSERFEVFIDGMEIANGFSELTNAQEQRQRLLADKAYRQQRQMHCPSIDERFLAALEAGLPVCAGVAVGLDRLLMVLSGARHIAEVNCFTLENN